MSVAALLALMIGAATPSPTAECDVGGQTATEEDLALARTACETARSSFAELFGEPVSGVRIVIWDRPNYRAGLLRDQAAVFWPSSEVMSARVVDPAAAERHVASQWREVLPHEIAHVLLAARFYGDAESPLPAGYATPLPDWLDEAVAIWAEPEESRKKRVEQARALPAERLDLQSILTSPHPAIGNAAAYTARDGTAAIADETLWAFYPQSIAVLAFIHELGGSEAVRELTRRLVTDPQDAAAILGLPGLPEEMDDIVAAWERWLARDDAGRAAD